VTSPPARALSIALAALIAVAAFVASTGGAHEQQPSIPHLTWSGCGDGLQCATASVPLDHDRPDGRQITLALAKLPAGDAQHRIGTLFVNNGGPGNSVLEFMHGDVRSVVPAEVQARFDVVGFDPRGVGASTPIRCFSDVEAQRAALGSLPVFPVSVAEIDAVTKAGRELGRACRARNGALLDHVGTADVARDLELLRRAVGDDRLSFAGYSYGGLIGLAYAQLHPDLVRSMVLDGTPDPIAWFGTTATQREPFSVRVDSHLAAADALGFFADSCQEAGPQRCAIASDDTRGRLDTLLAKLRERPITLDLPEGPAGPGGPTEITYAFVVDGLRGGLQFPPIWSDLAGLLQLVDAEATPQPATARDPDGPAPGADSYDSRQESQLAVACSETRNPHDPRRWPSIAERADAEANYFGADFAWLALPCATWPARAADPVRFEEYSSTAGPILFVSSEHDAAATLDRAKGLASRVPGARLLTVAGAGHPASFLGGDCVSEAESAALVAGHLPEAGARCPQAVAPFG
jgi:pimeloyl-ACP methyl ester carboxylesterase